MGSTATHQPLTQAIVEAVAEADDVDPLDLPPLYETVDPDALETLFTATNTSPRSTGKVTFEYSGHTVVVSSDGSIMVADEQTALEEPL